MSSIHIEAKVGEIAETVLLPGDPLRAKFVAENLLENAVCYNRVRNMFGYTGTYHGKRVSIQGSGMGMGSSAIYVNELIHTYHVKNIIRVGTCGAIQKDITLGQVLLAVSASGDSGANAAYFNGMHYAATADFDLLLKAYNIAKDLQIKTIQGSIFSTDTFYDDIPNRWDIWEKHGIIGVEMESQILYTLAKRLGAKALSVLTVSDNIVTGQVSGAKEREQAYMDMMKIALELA
ncbi:MAG: purine-nucleoside phosphorylase [Saprospiraceae bacterium]|nr:purine-nucleoside phosphorylase [Saprospiraceae bacterium]MBK6566462.1 purine-nucleoside phosphorylase [Saprospiraceae bacterium]MBK7524403.1 purine-nucleoside phosphorylase [Saprospiraceae bacterium]MBK8080926.1 purine-nucleoside phosphorylase [Saprospiraceae bacterium]